MFDLEDIKNIIFDFGGVIINIDFNKTYKEFEKLNVNHLSEVFSKAKQTELFNHFEQGIISDNEFRIRAKKHLNINISDQEFDNAWNSMILDIPYERIHLLNKTI